MKKKLFAGTLMCLLCVASMAQSPARRDNVPPPPRYTASFESQHGESFSVFIDGELQNRMPQSRVMVNDINGTTHEVVVVLKRPAEKAAVLSLRPGEPNVKVMVNYDRRLEKLYLYTPEHNRPQAEPNVAARRTAPRPGPEVQPDPAGNRQQPEPEVRIATEDEVVAMAARMKQQSFDSDRLALGKVIAASAANLTAAQIATLAATLDFSNSQVEFLKYAYSYCVDKPNYYKTVDVLTFSSDKQKVLDYIATQR